MEKTYNPALIQRTQRYMETHSIILALKPKARSTPPPRHSPPRRERSSHHGTGY